MANRVGERFGDYRLVCPLGRGTFGDVYLGEHAYNSSAAAVKVFNINLTLAEVKDFINEVRTLLVLKHPNIVQLLDFGIDENNLPYLIMEYAPNGTFRQHHPRGTRLPLSDVVSYTKQIAAALQYAHDQRLIHRDVKPENMLFGANNAVLLSDFGIAVVAHNPSSQRTENSAGTPLYMAPEQWQLRPLPASDQYALGVIVYEWLCGKPPFWGTIAELSIQHKEASPPPMRDLVPGISPAIEQVVFTALAKDPQRRFGSIQMFAHALEQAYAAELSQPVNVVPPSFHMTGPSAPLSQTAPFTQTASFPQTGEAPSWFTSSFTPPHSPVSPTQTAQRTPQTNTANLDALYREGFLARSQGGLNNLERAAELWQRILDAVPDYGNGTLIGQMRQLREELEPLQEQRSIQLYRQQAEQANRTGAWQQEASAWEALLQLSPKDREARKRVLILRRQQAEHACKLGDWQQEIDAWEAVRKLERKDEQARERLAIAEQNLRFAWMYDNARQFVYEGNLPAARNLLQELWQTENAPNYGDPAGLAARLQMPGYDEIKAVETKKHLVKDLGGQSTVWFCAFCLLAGIGATTGILTQSWLWAVLTVALLTPLAYRSGYRKVISPLSLTGIAVLSAVAVALLAFYTSTFPSYDQPQVSNLGFWLGDQNLVWLGRQIYFGLIIGLIATFWFICRDREEAGWDTLPEMLTPGLVGGIFGGLFGWVICGFLARLFDCGFGLGFGWYISWIALVIGSVSSTGLAAWIFVLRSKVRL